MINRIKNIKESFDLYIKLLKEFKKVNKGEINDLSNQEEFLSNDIKNQLNKIKEDFF